MRAQDTRMEFSKGRFDVQLWKVELQSVAFAVSEDRLRVRAKCTCIIFDILVYAGNFCIMMFTS